MCPPLTPCLLPLLTRTVHKWHDRTIRDQLSPWETESTPETLRGSLPPSESCLPNLIGNLPEASAPVDEPSTNTDRRIKKLLKTKSGTPRTRPHDEFTSGPCPSPIFK